MRQYGTIAIVCDQLDGDWYAVGFSTTDFGNPIATNCLLKKILSDLAQPGRSCRQNQMTIQNALIYHRQAI